MSTSAPWTLKNECANPQCQHHKDTHHEGKYNCLAFRCDCQRFYKAGEYEPAKKAALKPVDDEAPDTPRMPSWPWP